MEMSAYSLIGTVLFSICAIPQVMRTIKEKDVPFSASFLHLWSLGTVLLFNYIGLKFGYQEQSILLFNYILNTIVLSILWLYKYTETNKRLMLLGGYSIIFILARQDELVLYSGLVGSICFIICALPEAIKSIRTGSSEHWHPLTLYMWFGGEVFILMHVILKLELNLILLTNYSLNLMFVCIILLFFHFPEQGKRLFHFAQKQ